MRISDWSSYVCSSDLSLRFGQAKAGDRADFLDHVDLLAAVAGEDDVEFGLFLSSRGASATAGRSSRNSDSSGGRNAPLLFQKLGEFRRFQNGQVRKVVNDFLKVCN